MSLSAFTAIVERKQDLTVAETVEAIGAIMSGEAPADEVARFLTALHKKGEAADEIVGAAQVLRRRMTPIRCRHAAFIDTCGTGGDGSKTFNISTAAALVIAAAGVPVAKHGNRSMTSRSGSADVLVLLGVNVEADVACVERCLDELGICFCFAPLLHRAMKHVSEVRRSLGFPTIFNILGPLANPAAAPHQLLGVGRAPMQPLMAEALQKLGARRALVVHGAEGLDEVSLRGPTHVVEVTEEGLRAFDWTPADFGLQPIKSDEALRIDGPEQSAKIIREIFDGREGPARDIVLMNAAAALWTVGAESSLADCMRRTTHAADSGKAKKLLERLAAMSHE
jgi:anthranilate phosphoribosyltransferase